MTPIALPVQRGLLTVLTVAAITGRDERTLLKLVDGGELEWVFDIRSSQARGTRCVRVATLSVADFVAGRRAARTFSEIIHAIVPGQSSTVTRTQVAREFCCSADHAAHLFPCTSSSRGPNSTPRIPRAEIVSFLERRRIL